MTKSRASHRTPKASYAPRLKAVAEAAKRISPPGDCLTWGAVGSFPLPGIQIARFGEVPLPITPFVVRAIAQQTTPATMGSAQSRQPVVFAAHEFCTMNPAWPGFVAELVDASRIRLGLSPSMALTMRASSFQLNKLNVLGPTNTDARSFGTLVVVLPGEFQGAELVVDGSRCGDDSLYSWPPDAEEPLALKYAVFYNSAQVHSKPLTQGCVAYLTYDLVAAQANDVPRLAVQRDRFDAFHDALTAFFGDSDGTRKPRNAKFVHVLSQSYAPYAELSFSQVSGPADKLLAASLAKFCEWKNRAFALFLCRMEPRTCRSNGDTSRYLASIRLSGWIEHLHGAEEDDDEEELLPCSGRTLKAAIHAEVLPIGVLDSESRISKGELWSGSDSESELDTFSCRAALVVVPFELKLKLAFATDPTKALAKWCSLVRTNAALATRAAVAFGKAPQKWSMVIPSGEAVLRMVATRLCSMEVFRGIVASCATVEFQPRLRDVVVIGALDWTAVVTTLRDVCDRWGPHSSNTVNLVTSVLANETDTARIATVLDEVQIEPHVSRAEYRLQPRESSPTPSDYARVLQLAYRVSIARLDAYVHTDDEITRIELVSPAMRHWLAQVPSAELPTELRTVVKATLDRLDAFLDQLIRAEFAHARVECPFRRSSWETACAVCDKLGRFVANHDAREMTLSAHKVAHAEKSLRASRQLEHRIVTTPPGHHRKAVLRKTCRNAQYDRGEKEAHALAELLARWPTSDDQGRPS